MYYDLSVISGKGLELVYNLMNKEKSVPPTNIECIQTLIKQQVALFPESIDHRQIFGDENDNIFM